MTSKYLTEKIQKNVLMNEEDEKFIRKKQLLSYLKHKPVLILEGEFHLKNRSFITSFFGHLPLDSFLDLFIFKSTPEFFAIFKILLESDEQIILENIFDFLA